MGAVFVTFRNARDTTRPDSDEWPDFPVNIEASWEVDAGCGDTEIVILYTDAEVVSMDRGQLELIARLAAHGTDECPWAWADGFPDGIDRETCENAIGEFRVQIGSGRETTRTIGEAKEGDE
jgi:hypothetical protein